MSEIVATILSAMFGGGLIGGITSVVIKLLEQRKTGAETEKIAAEAEKIAADTAEALNDTALALVKSLRQELADVRADRDRDQAEARANREQDRCAMREMESTIAGLTVRVGTMERALGEANDQIEDMACRHDALERKYAEVVNGANDQADQIRGMGGEPIYTPPPRIKRE